MPQVLQNDGTVAFSTATILAPAEDPRTRRYGYSAGALSIEMDARISGRAGGNIRPGKMEAFRSAPMKVQHFTADPEDQRPPEFIDPNALVALDCITAVKNKAVVPGVYDLGFRELIPLTPLTDLEAQQAFGYIHPEFDAVGVTCPKQDSAHPITVCATCRLEILSNIPARNPIEGELKNILIDANKAWLGFAREQWSKLKAEYKGRKDGQQAGILNLKESHLHFMRHLHEIHPDDEAANTAAAYGAQASQAVIDGIAKAMEKGNGDPSRVAELEARLNAEKEARERQQEQIDQLLAARKPGRPPKQQEA